MIERLGGKDEMRSAVSEARREGRTIGFVPTMGALHEGHIALVRAACKRTDFVVVSVFVNPTQFGPSEDFSAYPRRVESDLELLAAEGVDVVFTPTTDVMYSRNPQVTVNPGQLAERWEGEVRPGHFVGVATIVTKLFSVVRPDLAFFGEKDYQQLLVVRKLVTDLDLAVGVVGVKTVREGDGLALSSRNSYLSAGERVDARALPDALEAAAEALAWGERDARVLETAMRDAVDSRDGRVRLDYAAVVDADTLEPLTAVSAPSRAIIAARVGDTRLIDNCELRPANE
ncbi:MAG TPA: pantoate--beta-alanine ligase [Coriobacteriia bacterium]|nr:pantoate--beta-alanine ligase [Coriobacteriia bacterium]